MPSSQLSRNDRLLIGAILLVAAASAIYISANYTAAFPQASLNLKLTRDQITTAAQRFLQTQGFSPVGYRNLTLFDPDDDARIYLEREIGLERANRLMQGEVSVWRWRARWYRPPHKEEFRVQLSPDGTVVGFSHPVPEASPGARLARDAAFQKAEAFLKSITSRPQRLIETQLIERPARYDYSFTWEREGFRVKEATYRINIVVQGDRIGEYREGLHIPESWQRSFAAMRSRNQLYALGAGALWVPLVIAAIVWVVISMRRHNIPWRRLLQVSLLVATLVVINQWNQLPFFFDHMPTSSHFANTLALGVLQAMGAGVAMFFYLIIPAAAGEPLYRAMLPSKLSLPGIFTLRGIYTKKFFLGTLTGYGFAAAHLAYVVAFYLIGRRFGVWSPQDVSYSDLVSTWLPWIYPLATALMAAASEEFWFRLFAIPMLRQLFRWTPLALVVPALIWGFLHASYPQEPAYIRGVEVGLIGIAAGVLMLRFGIITTLVWHYTVDAVLMSTFLFQSENWYFRLSGVLVGGAVLFPLLISLAGYARRGSFKGDEQVLNSSLDRAAQLAEQESLPAGGGVESDAALPVPAPQRLWPKRWIYVAAVLAVTAGIFARPVIVGSWIRIGSAETRAEEVAGRALRTRGMDPTRWMRATRFLSNIGSAEFEYLREVAGVHSAEQILRQYTTSGVWVVRYFQPQRREQWQVILTAGAQLFRIDHELEETAPGPRLSSQDALQVADRFLAARGINPASYRLVDSEQEHRDNRTDHAFTWENLSFHAGEARARLSLRINGDEPSQFRKFLKLPENWLRNFNRPRLQAFLLPGLLGAIGLPALVVFLRRLSGRHAPGAPAHRYHWRAYLAVAGAGLALSALSSWNDSRLLFTAYDTATPLGNFMAQVWIMRLLGIVFLTLLALVAAMVVDVFWQLTLHGVRFNAPSVTTTLALTALFAAGTRLLVAIAQAVPGPWPSVPVWQVPGAGTWLPAITVLQHSFLALMAVTAVLAVALLGGRHFLTRRAQRIFLGVACFATAAGSAQTVQQFAAFAVLVAASIAVLLLVLRTCGGDLVSYVVAFYWAHLSSRVLVLLVQPDAALRWNGVLAAAVAITAGIWLILRSVPSRRAV